MSVLDSLREICEILFSTPCGSSYPDRAFTAVEWLVRIEKELKTDDPLLTKAENNVEMIIPNLLRLVRECLSTHRWSQLIPLTKQLSKDRLAVFWKTSMEVLYTSEESQPLVQQLVKQLQTVQHLNSKEVLMEYLMFLLHHGNIDDAKQVSQQFIKPKAQKKAETARSIHTDILFKAYQSLVWYVEWASAKVKVEDLHEDSGHTSSYEEVMAMYAQKAIVGFQQIWGETGVWDIFITKYVEILEYSDKMDEARELLTQYRDKNTENLNAHKYLYYFSVRNDGNKEEQIQLLMNIAEASPSDSLVLDLCDRLILDERISEAVVYLFTLLDYSCWKNEIKPWQLLLDLVTDNHERHEIQQAVQECWKIREIWWPQFHFTSYGCTQREKECLCYLKAKLAVNILGLDISNILNDIHHLSKTESKMLQQT